MNITVLAPVHGVIMNFQVVLVLVLIEIGQYLVSVSSQSASASNDADADATILKNLFTKFSTTYPTHSEMETSMFQLQATFPDSVRVYSIGQSVLKKELRVVQLTANVKEERPLLTPMVKIVANMHGDESLGRSLTLMLAVWLLQGSLDKDPRAAKILQSTDIHLLPSMNPDGFENATEGACAPNPNRPGRRNANRKDLTHDFPEQFHLVLEDQDDEEVEPGQLNEGGIEDLVRNRQPETAAVIKWILNNSFVLSANLHGGSLVVNYPFDSIPSARSSPNQRGVKSLSPDNAVFVHLARVYAEAHPTMAKESVTCGNDKFDKGITNGADWLQLKGGMQDFNYAYSNCFEITVELSCCKYPESSTLLREWNNHKEPLLRFLEQAGKLGVKGRVLTENGQPVNKAQIIVDGIDHSTSTNERGEYWRLLLPGQYKIGVQMGSKNLGPKKSVTVKNSPVVLDFAVSSSEVTKGAGTGVIRPQTTQLNSRQGTSGSGSASSASTSPTCNCNTWRHYHFYCSILMIICFQNSK